MASITQAEYDSLISRLAAVEEENAATLLEVDTFFLLWASALIFMMQAGFATLSAGSIRAKNVKNILLKNVLDACVGAIVWYCVGYGLAYDADNGVNGPCNAASR